MDRRTSERPRTCSDMPDLPQSSLAGHHRRGVGASRIVDNKHHPSDVVAGAVLGSAVGLLYVMRAIPRHRRLDELDESDAEAIPAAPLLGSGPGGMQRLGPSDTV